MNIFTNFKTLKKKSNQSSASYLLHKPNTPPCRHLANNFQRRTAPDTHSPARRRTLRDTRHHTLSDGHRNTDTTRCPARCCCCRPVAGGLHRRRSRILRRIVPVARVGVLRRSSNRLRRVCTERAQSCRFDRCRCHVGRVVDHNLDGK